MQAASQATIHKHTELDQSFNGHSCILVMLPYK